MSFFNSYLFISIAKVYKNFDENEFNFNNCEDNEILFFVNLDEEHIVSKEENEL